jgi:phage terminase Nu1 subunit (DNA packaging protein)
MLSDNMTKTKQMRATLRQHISCSKLAALLDVSTRTIRNWATNPLDPLPGLRVRGVWLFNVERVQEWLERQNKTVDMDAMVDGILNKFK